MPMATAERCGRMLLAPALLLLLGAAPAETFNARLLSEHNRARAEVGVGALVWDETLARHAAGWANHLVKVGTLVHSPDDPADPDPEGENLWAGTRGSYGPGAMVGLWVAEKRNFRDGHFPANSRTGDLEDVGHYTQVVWRSTRRVGCARARGAADDFLVCRYAEGGNVIGERPF
jgi:hypothetical protein